MTLESARMRVPPGSHNTLPVPSFGGVGVLVRLASVSHLHKAGGWRQGSARCRLLPTTSRVDKERPASEHEVLSYFRCHVDGCSLFLVRLLLSGCRNSLASQ